MTPSLMTSRKSSRTPIQSTRRLRSRIAWRRHSVARHLIWPVIVAVGVVIAPDVARAACEYCYGSAGDNEITRGIGMAMGALIGITGIIGVGTFSFFRRMAVRTRLLEAGGFEVSQNGEMIDPQKLTP